MSLLSINIVTSIYLAKEKRKETVASICFSDTQNYTLRRPAMTEVLGGTSSHKVTLACLMEQHSGVVTHQ